jgi:predicted enzyme related to lactoylglutathione lyase
MMATAPDEGSRSMGAPVVHFEIICDDYKTISTFYGGLFDWKFDTDNPVGYGVVQREDNLNPDGLGIGGGVMGMAGHPEMEGYGGHVTFYVEVPDVEAALQKAVELGGQRMMGPQEVPGGPTIGQFLDPENRMVGVVQAGTMG